MHSTHHGCNECAVAKQAAYAACGCIKRCDLASAARHVSHSLTTNTLTSHLSLTHNKTQGIITAVIGLGTLNRVLYRLALVPLKDYVFFLAQAQNVGYIVIYYLLLLMRVRCVSSCWVAG